MTRNEEFPLYPYLPEVGRQEAQELVDAFKIQLTKVAKEAISELYCDVAVFIESDSWGNFRNKIMDGFKNYNNRKIQAEYDFKDIRRQIYKEYRDEIIKDLNQDLLDENKDLKHQLELEREWNKRRY